MFQKLLTMLAMLFFSCLAMAENCPTVKDIKNNLTQGWGFYDSEDNKQLSAQRVDQFKKEIDQFAAAEWNNNNVKKAGPVHCFYRDKEGSELETYVAKANNNFVMNNTNDYWYQVSGVMQCAAGADQCLFSQANTNTASNVKQLAKK